MKLIKTLLAHKKVSEKTISDLNSTKITLLQTQEVSWNLVYDLFVEFVIVENNKWFRRWTRKKQESTRRTWEI